MRFSAKFAVPVLAAASIASGTFSGTAVAQWENYIGQIAVFGFDFCPEGWIEANGQPLEISQNNALFSLLGKTYGGTIATFNVPDLRGRSPVGTGNADDLDPVIIGTKGGSQSFTLTTEQMPSHNHTVVGSTTTATETDPAGATLGQSTIYVPGIPSENLNSASIASTGGTQSISKQSPFLGLTICIAWTGLYPSRD